MLLDHRLLTFWDAHIAGMSSEAEFGTGLFDVLGLTNYSGYERAASLLQQRRTEILK